jgi:hypothetical protein
MPHSIEAAQAAFLPIHFGIGSENAAHRFAVEWDEDGQSREGVFIPRRDSSSRLNALLGGRIVAGVHHHAKFTVQEDRDNLKIAFTSDDGQVRARIAARVSTEWPRGSIFGSLGEASRFFEAGSLGYSGTRNQGRYECLELRCESWSVQALAVAQIESSFFDDPAKFPPGAATFDCALLMREVKHSWRSLADLSCDPDGRPQAASSLGV